MIVNEIAKRRSQDVKVALNFMDKRAPNTIMYEMERESSTLVYDPRVVDIFDARTASKNFSLEETGFELVTHSTTVSDFYDTDQVRKVYFSEIEQLVKRLTGATTVFVYAEAVRSEGPQAKTNRQPARAPHIDWRDQTVQWFIRQLAGEDRAKELLKHRYVQMNLWRPIKPVKRTPLAVCDASTVRDADLVPTRVGTTRDDPNPLPLYSYNVAYGEAQKWYYYPEMQPNEVLVFKLSDSDSQRVQYTAHSAIDLPNTPEDAPIRESIEVRTIAIFEN